MIDLAYAMSPSGGGGPKEILQGLLPILLMIVIFYFLLIRPQQKKAKKHQEFIGGLKRGDDVLTSSGIYGKITGITDNVITLEIAKDIRIKVSKQTIAGKATIDTSEQS